jgi:hypothetical protein
MTKNPYPYPGQEKSENLKYAMTRIEKFCELNKLRTPKVVNKYLNSYGLYIWGKDDIYVNIERAKNPIGSPGFSWSYTGYKADLTVSGILAHECGHYIDSYFNWPSKKMNLFVGKETNVSSYEPNAKEKFAESMKLFILNPDLLKTGRPMRYKFLTEVVNLKPEINDPWEVVLQNAHPKLISAAKSWILKGKNFVYSKDRFLYNKKMS